MIIKTAKSAYLNFRKVAANDRFLLSSTVSLVLLLIVFKAPTSNGSFFLKSAVQHYIEETSISIQAAGAQADNQLADISGLASADADTNGGQGGPVTTLDPSTIQENSIQASDPSSTDYIDSFKPDQVVEYTVQSGDTIGSIADDFGVSINTIIWANNIKNPNSLSLGQVLKIPPVTGVIYTVKKGDTVNSIAKKFAADSSKILSFNNLAGDRGLEIGNELMVPDGKMPDIKPYVPPTKSVAVGTKIYTSVGNGQCVPFVQAHGFANLHGDAYKWAKYINTTNPSTNDAVVLKGGKYGHVALITAVKPNSIQVVEQNFYGPYIVDHREISLSDRSIVGFIQ